MTVLTEEARRVIDAGKLAHLVTLNRDGSPQVTIVWVGRDGDELVSAHLFPQQKLRNIRRDPRVSLSLESGTVNEMGLAEYLVVHGIASITEGGAPELLQELAERYIGPGVKFPPTDNPPPGYITHIRPTRIGGIGPWAQAMGEKRA